MHRIVREEFPVLLGELCSQSFVVRDDERWLPDVGDNIRYGESLPGTGHTQKGLVSQALFDTVRELSNSLRLVSGRLEFLVDFKDAHIYIWIETLS